MTILRWQSIATIAFVAAAWLSARELGAAGQRQRASWPAIAEHRNPDLTRLLLKPYPELAADLAWVRALVYYGSSMAGEADYRYLERFLDSIIRADPRFYRPYRWAAYATAFQKEQPSVKEFRLSLKYLEQAMKQFPDKYELFWLAGLRYYTDLAAHAADPAERRQYQQRGAELMEQAMHKPDAPDDLATRAASMRLKLGQKERALHDLREMILTTDDKAVQAKLIEAYNRLAETKFPDEEKRAKEEFEARWQRELPFATPSMYVVLGDRPSPVIRFDTLATERDLIGADVEPEAEELSAR